jgi:hypothetical protein
VAAVAADVVVAAGAVVVAAAAAADAVDAAVQVVVTAAAAADADTENYRRTFLPPSSQG